MKVLAAAVGLIILVSFGCNRTNYGRSTDLQIEWAYQLIDQGSYSEAIDLFSSILQQDDSSTVRIGLASAYAAKAGIKVQNYWELILPSIKASRPSSFESTKKFKEDFNKKLAEIPEIYQKAILEKFEDIIAAQDQVEELKWRFSKIPIIETDDQKQDLISARSIIKDLSEKGSHLYRALLGLIILRFEATKSAHLFSSIIATKAGWPCPLVFKKWLQQIPIILDLTSDIFVDIKIAYPSKITEINPLQKNYENHHLIINNTFNQIEFNLCSEH